MRDYKDNPYGTNPTPDVGWVAEPSLDDQKYDQDSFKKFMKLAPEERQEVLERLLAHNPDRPIVDECNMQFESLGESTRLTSIEPMTVCYDTSCAVCNENINAWSDGYYVSKTDGQSTYICGDRHMCSSRILARVFKGAVKSDEVANGTDDSWLQNFQ